MLDHKKIAEELVKRTSAASLKDVADVSYSFEPIISKLFSSLEVGSAVSSKYVVQKAAFLFDGLSQKKDYAVLGIDGSQVYPDPELDSSQLAVVNVGGILLSYGAEKSSVDFLLSTEFVTRKEIEAETEAVIFSAEMIDLLRFIRELEYGVESYLKHKNDTFLALLFDGSMIPQSLILKNNAVQKMIMNRYQKVLLKIREYKIPVCWYTSSPQARIWSTLVGASDSDAELLKNCLKKGQFSPVLSTAKNIVFGCELDRFDVTAFGYVSTDDEIVRLEFPRWILLETELFNNLISVVFDQVSKGYGYPVALTEAHCQVVVSEAERQFLLNQFQEKSYFSINRTKNMRKRIIPV